MNILNRNEISQISGGQNCNSHDYNNNKGQLFSCSLKLDNGTEITGTYNIKEMKDFYTPFFNGVQTIVYDCTTRFEQGCGSMDGYHASFGLLGTGTARYTGTIVATLL